MIKLVMLRHGESLWNLANRFTGWTDVDLSERGVREAHEAAKLLIEAGYSFDIALTSLLKRSIRTLWIVLDEMDLMWLTVHRSWRLNERHYGALQGLNKQEMVDKYGFEQVMQWRRGYAVLPPALDYDDRRHPRFEAKYADVDAELLPSTESLKVTLERVLPYWHETVVPLLKAGRRVLIVAHGNSMRALVKYLDSTPDDEITGLNIPTGIPLVYELDDELRAIRHYYLADEETVARATATVAGQIRGSQDENEPQGHDT